MNMWAALLRTLAENVPHLVSQDPVMAERIPNLLNMDAFKSFSLLPSFSNIISMMVQVRRRNTFL